jgi:hypothetical protein
MKAPAALIDGMRIPVPREFLPQELVNLAAQSRPHFQPRGPALFLTAYQGRHRAGAGEKARQRKYQPRPALDHLGGTSMPLIFALAREP